ncbi:MAG: hypothetical protein AB8D52_12400 [Gammaproteobacteria bacterium]
MKWIHIEDNQFDLNPDPITKAFLSCGFSDGEAIEISDQIVCGHGYSITSKNDIDLDQLAKLLKLHGVKIRCK